MKALVVFESMYGNTHAVALRRRGLDVVDHNSFLVADAEGPLEDGELDRAHAWGEALRSDHLAS